MRPTFTSVRAIQYYAILPKITSGEGPYWLRPMPTAETLQHCRAPVARIGPQIDLCADVAQGLGIFPDDVIGKEFL